jgi:diguanylate cyclase (GGDEF)-like protein
VTARTWTLWRLPRWLAVFVVGVVTCYLLALASAAALVQPRARQLELFGALLLFGVLSIELTRLQGEASEFTKDVHGIWHIPVAILLPPVYCMLAPVVKMLLVQGRVDRKPLYRRAFTAASHGLSYGAASVIFHAVAPALPRLAADQMPHWVAWTALAAGCAMLQEILNTTMIAIAVKGSDRSVSVRSRQFTLDPLYNDLAEISAGTLLAVLLAATGTWLLLVLALPLVTLLHRSLRHAQLSDAARIDAKTRLLNASTWHREASAELARVARDQAPVTLAILDIDHFKRVNDTYGHLAGDGVLVALAGIMRGHVRDGDLVGRFGGEEFTILFPRTNTDDAVRIAERLREAVSAIALPAGQAGNVTVSIGLATSDVTRIVGTDLDELIIAADAALYRAKGHGRNQVCALPEPGRLAG